MKSKSAQKTNAAKPEASRTTKAPAIVTRLMDSYVTLGDASWAESAFREAQRVVALDIRTASSIDGWVQRTGERYLRKCAPEILEGGDYHRDGGTLQVAFSEPSFAVGFYVAYLLFKEPR